jgi:hypothetical protein
MSLYDNYFIRVKKDFKPIMVRKRKEFMELLLKALSDDKEAASQLANRFGTKLVAETANGSTVSLLVDGELAFKAS